MTYMYHVLSISNYFDSSHFLTLFILSLTSTVERLDFIAGFKEVQTDIDVFLVLSYFILWLFQVVRTKESWLIAIGCSVPQGVVIAWTAMMVRRYLR